MGQRRAHLSFRRLPARLMRLDVNAFLGAYPCRRVPGTSPDAVLSAMDRVGIDEAWVSHLPSVFWRDPTEGNGWLLETAGRHARFRPVPAVHPELVVEGRGSPTATIPRVENAEVHIDGRLDEPVWAQATRLTGFWQYQPVDGRPAEEETEVLVWYAPDAIHFGIIAHDRSPAAHWCTAVEGVTPGSRTDPEASVRMAARSVASRASSWPGLPRRTGAAASAWRTSPATARFRLSPAWSATSWCWKAMVWRRPHRARSRQVARPVPGSESRR